MKWKRYIAWFVKTVQISLSSSVLFVSACVLSFFRSIGWVFALSGTYVYSSYLPYSWFLLCECLWVFVCACILYIRVDVDVSYYLFIIFFLFGSFTSCFSLFFKLSFGRVFFSLSFFFFRFIVQNIVYVCVSGFMRIVWTMLVRERVLFYPMAIWCWVPRLSYTLNSICIQWTNKWSNTQKNDTHSHAHTWLFE